MVYFVLCSIVVNVHVQPRATKPVAQLTAGLSVLNYSSTPASLSLHELDIPRFAADRIKVRIMLDPFIVNPAGENSLPERINR